MKFLKKISGGQSGGVVVDNATVNAAIAEDVKATRAALAVMSANPIRRVCNIGTSITDNGSSGSGDVISTTGASYITVAKIALGNTFEMCRRNDGYPSSPDVGFGYPGYTSQRLKDGFGGYYPALRARETYADTVVIEAGANDVAAGAALTAVAAATAIIALWDSLIPFFDRVIVCNVMPQGATVTDAATVRNKIIEVNDLLAAAAAIRNVILFDAYSAIPVDADGYALASHIHDGIHPNTKGAHAIGLALAEVMRPYCDGGNYNLPANGAKNWLNSNRLLAGSNSLPSGWLLSSGTAMSYAAIDESATGGLLWQRISGTPNGNNPATPVSIFASFGPQTEVVQAVLPNANAGSATVTVTHPKLAGSPLAISFEVGAGDANTVWAAAMLAALQANNAIQSLFVASITSGSLVTLSQRINDRNFPTFRIAVQLPGVSSSTGWLRWTASLKADGGYRHGDKIRACARFRNVAGSPIHAFSITAQVNDGVVTRDASCLTYFAAAASEPTEAIDGLYLTEPFEAPPSGYILLYVRAYGINGAAVSYDVRDVGLFVSEA